MAVTVEGRMKSGMELLLNAETPIVCRLESDGKEI
jgi:hypothetical protein